MSSEARAKKALRLPCSLSRINWCGKASRHVTRTPKPLYKRFPRWGMVVSCQQPCESAILGTELPTVAALEGVLIATSWEAWSWEHPANRAWNPHNYKKLNACCFKSLSYGIICCISNRKLVQGVSAFFFHPDLPWALISFFQKITLSNIDMKWDGFPFSLIFYHPSLTVLQPLTMSQELWGYFFFYFLALKLFSFSHHFQLILTSNLPDTMFIGLWFWCSAISPWLCIFSFLQALLNLRWGYNHSDFFTARPFAVIGI